MNSDGEIVLKQLIYYVKEGIPESQKEEEKASIYIDIYSEYIMYNISSEDVMVLLLGLIL